MKTTFASRCFGLLPALGLLVSDGFGAPPYQLLPGDAAIGPAAGIQQTPAIARGEDKLLVVWADGRGNGTGGSEYETASDIYGLRLDAAGNPLDPVPFPVFAGPAVQDKPQVVWNGSLWLVTFETVGLSGTGYYYDRSVVGVRVTPEGEVLDTTPICLNGLVPSGYGYAAASDGVNWVIVNQNTATGTDIMAMRISPAGVVLDPPTRVIVPGTHYQRSNFKLAYAADVFLLTFDGAYVNGTFTTEFVRFDSNLNVLDPAPATLLPVGLSALAANDTGFYIVWNRQEPDYSVVVAGSRVSTAGVRLDGNGVNLSGTKQPYAYSPAAVNWDGGNWRVTWGTYGTAWVARVDGAGVVLDPGSVATTLTQNGPTAGTGNGSVQMVWQVYADADNDILTANIAPNNVAGPSRTLSLGAPMQLRPDLAVTDTGYMLVYRSSVAAGSRVLAQPLDSDGHAVTAEPIQLDSGPNLSGPGVPNVAWNGAVCVVAWGTSAGVVAQRVRSDGTKVDAAPTLIAPQAFGPADVAAIGDTFLVVARKYGYTPQFIDAYGVRVRGSDGALLDAAPRLIVAGYVSRPPAVTALGGRFFVALHSNWSHDESGASTVGAFVPTTGTDFSVFGIHLFSTAGGNFIFELGLASDGQRALLVQSAEVTSGVENDLVAWFIGADGTLSPMLNLTPWSGNQYRPRVAWDGTDFIVAYQDQKNRLAVWALEQLDARCDLFGMRISPEGVILDPQGFLLTASPLGETDPTVASADGLSLFAASYMVNKPSYANYRIACASLDGSANTWPVAVAAAGPAEGDVPLTVNFSSAGSTDLDGSLVSYLWDFRDGSTSTAPNPTHTFTTPSPYVVMLTVTDNGGATATQTVLVKATPVNEAPIATASADKLSGPAPLDVVFSSAGSYDPDGSLGNMEWHYGDGTYSYGNTGYKTFYSPGTYTVTLVVYDNRGASGTAQLTVVVGPANQPPIAQGTASPTSGTAPLMVSFNSGGSSDPDGSIVSRSWNFGDGTTSSAANPSHTYTSAGAFTATLTVTDNLGATGTAALTINVAAPPGVMRVTAISLTARLRSGTVTVDGAVTVRNSSNAAVAGALVNITWTRPGGSTATQSATTDASGVARFTTSGVRGTYTLRVNDVTKTGYTFDRAGSVLTKSIKK